MLITSRSYVGHFLPMRPLAQALVAAGHEVACASGPGVREPVSEIGIAYFRAGPDQLTEAERGALFPEIKALAPEEIRAFFFGRVFAQHEIPLRAADMADVIDAWKPDVLVHEVAELAAPLVATSRGLPYTTHSYGAVLREDAIEAAACGARAFWLEAGLEPHERAGLWRYLYIDICPPALQSGVPQGAPAVQLLRPVERADGVARGGSTLIYVTLGTVYNVDASVFRTILEGIADEPADVLVTVGPQGDPASLGPVPPNVRVERFVPQAEVLPACRLVIGHGGSGTLFGALAFGCPMLIVPQGADQFVNAERVVASGAGLCLMPGELTPANVRVGVRRLMSDPSFARNAERIAREIALMPPPEQAVKAVERIVQ